MSAPSLKRNFALTLAGNFLYGGAQWGMLVVLAKLGSPELVGRFALALAVTAPVIMFANLNLRAVLATDAEGRHAFGDYMGLLLLMLAGGFAAVVLLSLRESREQLVVILIVGFAKLLEQFSELFCGLMQRGERMDLIALSLAFKGGASLLFFGGCMALTGSLPWACAGLAAAWALALFGFDAWNVRRGLGVPAAALLPRFEAGRLRELARLALPLGVGALLGSLTVNVPRWFVGEMLGERELGLFAAMSYVSVIGLRVVSALGETAVPRLARQHASRDAAAFRLLALQTAGVGLALGAAGVAAAALAGRPLLTLLYRPEYAERLDVFVWVMVAAGLSWVGIFLEYAMTGARSFVAQPVVLVAGIAVLALGCRLLIPAHGLAGAAMAMAASSALMLALRGALVRRIVAELESA
jgi:O-antigen/teichoic acid export membrane protein